MSVLSTSKLTKRFGGVVATSNVNLNVEKNKVHALIGPNGAGKTTLIAQLSGALASDEGRIMLNGRDITNASEPARVRAGLCRTFQISSLFNDFSVLDNVGFAAQAKAGHSYRFCSKATALSHGEQRQLEIAMALASEPTVLMLDEPMAGMGSEESMRLIQLLDKLKAQTTLLLVEHDMDAVFALADDLSVLVNGRLIATGPANEVRNNPDVIAAYLGPSA